ncbi:MAG: hypothetical protein ACP5GY_05035 [Vulcanisaeta sp.]
MSRGFTIGGLVIIALVIIVAGILTYLLSNYLYTTYESGRYVAELNGEVSTLSRSCNAYLSNGTLYFPYGIYVEYSIPNVVRPGMYQSMDLANMSGTVVLFARGCTIIVKSTGNAVGFMVVSGYGVG